MNENANVNPQDVKMDETPLAPEEQAKKAAAGQSPEAAPAAPEAPVEEAPQA